MTLKARFIKPPVMLASFAGALVLLSACGNNAAAPPDQVTQVGTYRIQRQAVTLTTDLPGRTHAWMTAEVRPQVSGVILKRMFVEGTLVKKGQQLYQIDSAPYQAAYDRAYALSVTAEQLAHRDQRLLADNAVSRQAADDATASYRQAEADVETAEINLRYTKVLSPISGLIGRSTVTEGALVTNDQATALATVRQLDPMYVDVTQTSIEMLKLRRELSSGQLQKSGDDQTAVRLTLDDGSTYPLTGSLKFAEVNVDEGTGTVTLRAIFPNPNHVLLPGMFVHARLDEGVAANAVLAPEQAVARDSTGKPYVWLVRDGKVERRDIAVARTIGNTWLVTSGLQAGDVVVAEGLQNLSPGMEVKTTPAENVHVDIGDAQENPSSADASASSASAPVAAPSSATAGE